MFGFLPISFQNNGIEVKPTGDSLIPMYYYGDEIGSTIELDLYDYRIQPTGFYLDLNYCALYLFSLQGKRENGEWVSLHEERILSDLDSLYNQPLCFSVPIYSDESFRFFRLIFKTDPYSYITIHNIDFYGKLYEYK